MINDNCNDVRLYHVKEGIKKYWDLGYKNYDSQDEYNNNRKNLLKRLNYICENSNNNVLDVGSGTGYISIIMAELGNNVAGIDFSKNMISIAEEKARNRNLSIKFYNGEAENLPFQNNSFDIVINRHLLWTLLDQKKAISEWLRVIKPGGKIILIDSVWSPKELKTQLFKLYIYISNILKGKTHTDDYSKYIKQKLPYYNGNHPIKFDGKIFTNGLDGNTIASMLQSFNVRQIRVEELGYQQNWSNYGKFSLRKYLTKGPYMFIVHGTIN